MYNNTQLNENHGIAAAGLQQPHTAIPPTTNNITNEPPKDYQETEAVTGKHPTTAEGPAILPESGESITNESTKNYEEAEAVTGVHPTTAAGPTVIPHTGGARDNNTHSATGVHDGHNVNREAPATTGQHPTTSAGLEATKPSAGDKIKGNLEKLAGKITGNEEKVIRGDNIAHGRV